MPVVLVIVICLPCIACLAQRGGLIKMGYAAVLDIVHSLQVQDFVFRQLPARGLAILHARLGKISSSVTGSKTLLCNHLRLEVEG